MGRVVRQRFVPGGTAELAGEILASWLTAYGFRILTRSADGTTSQYPAPEVILHTTPGQAILNVAAARGDVIGLNTTYGPRAAGWPFIALLRAEVQRRGTETGLLVTGEFFFATIAGVSSLGVKEWTPSSSIWGVGGVVRAKAWPIIEAFSSDRDSGNWERARLAADAAVRSAQAATPDAHVLRSVPPPPPPPSPGTIAAQVQRTSRMQSTDLVVAAATQVYTFMAFLLLVALIPISGLATWAMVASGFKFWLFDLSVLAIVGGTFLLGYSLYVAIYRVRRPLRRGETSGVASRALFLGVGGVVLGVLLGAALNWIAAIFCIPGVLYLLAYFRLRKISGA